jgi:peptide/nickel transport system permease protein
MQAAAAAPVRRFPFGRPYGAEGSLAARWRKSRRGVWAGLLVVGLIVLAVVGPWLAPYDPVASSLGSRLQAPSARHLFGTDDLGRDVLSRVLYGARLDFQLGLVSVAIGLSLGTVGGLVSGFYGGAVDALVMGVTDILLGFPYLLLGLVVVTALGPGMTNAMIAIGVVYVPQYIRLIRSMVLGLKSRDFVLAARALGASDARIMLQHILINAFAPIIVQSSLNFGAAIVTGAGFSFLGLGAQPPMAEWGRMLTDGRNILRQAPWVTTVPGLAILVTAIAFNVLGDSLRDVLDPRLRR